ncbi:hypothetical protein K3495_g2081 [Podosphaera aphanis]|nr:hypothetical protein K3495_g2081 [Podosphaera aphanis]
MWRSLSEKIERLESQNEMLESENKKLRSEIDDMERKLPEKDQEIQKQHLNGAREDRMPARADKKKDGCVILRKRHARERVNQIGRKTCVTNEYAPRSTRKSSSVTYQHVVTNGRRIGFENEAYNDTLILSRLNHEKWFRNIQFKAQAKGYFCVTQTTKEKHAWILREGGASQESDSKEKKIPIPAETAQVFDRDTAKFFSLLTDHLSDDDQSVFDEYQRPCDIWKRLKDKYDKPSEATASLYMKKIQDFPKEFDLEVKGKAKLENSDESFKNTCPEKFLFLISTKMLSKEYMSLLDSFRLRPDLTIQEKVEILEDKERDIKGSEYAHPAIDKNRKYKERRSSDIPMPDIPNEMLCYKCDGDDHLSRECPFANEIKSFGVALRKKFERRKLKQRHTKPLVKKKDVKSDKKKANEL